MTRVVEVCPQALAGVRADVDATCRGVLAQVAPLRSRMAALGVGTGGVDEAVATAHRLESHVLPVVDVHLGRARALADARYGGVLGAAFPVLDDPDPFTPAHPFVMSSADDGAAVLSWEGGTVAEQQADAQVTGGARGIGDWVADRWQDLSGAVDDGVDWLGEHSGGLWETFAGAGASIGQWWQDTTADLGAWIDENFAGVRAFLGRHVAVLRLLADVCQVIGKVVVALGAVATVALTVIGASGGAVAGAIFGAGVGSAPGGGAGAVAGLTMGLKVLGAGFTIWSVGDFLDVLADWGEGSIDGQDLVQQGSVELVLAATSLLGAGVIGKVLQKTWTRLPASVRGRVDDALERLFRSRRPLPDISDLEAIHPRHRNPVEPWAEQVAARHGTMTPEEVAAVYRYTTNSGFTEMNGYLRNPAAYSPADAARIQQDVDDAVAALSKLERTPGATVRGTHLPLDVLNDYQVGEVVSDSAFWSTTPDVAVAHQFRGNGNALITVISSRGTNVQQLSQFGNEAEILLPPGSRFVVVSRTQNPAGYWELTLEDAP